MMKMEAIRFLLLIGVMGSMVMGDVYLHIPRGSNNRLDEANRDRANGNRLFDSQNNNRGGYNVGTNIFVERSDLEISWTNQHACGGNPNTPGCEMVIQMMCDKNSRDGTSTNRINDNEESDLDYEYGRHESYYYYQTCKHTERNKGLFTASQNLQGDSMIYTRQNPNGNRRGYECPEGFFFFHLNFSSFSLLILFFFLTLSLFPLLLFLHKNFREGLLPPLAS